ncbi:hypothetical protein CSOJ01_13662 [Colletotrichum sojae]|uniref:Uncharacterized protein n=1 Tax=Colletotrichum sojae TaxID=2175907 RepID=A0A8H6MKX1_9PEZI|nr:hypothetical protein CSOJ01_13662 [Colletotrichum sojae]
MKPTEHAWAGKSHSGRGTPAHIRLQFSNLSEKAYFWNLWKPSIEMRRLHSIVTLTGELYSMYGLSNI